MEVKALTEAQQKHLTTLNDAVRRAQAALEQFAVYLRDEHQATDPEWVLNDIRVGFVRVEMSAEAK